MHIIESIILQIVEENIIDSLRSSPESALQWMYDNYYSYVCSVVYRMIKDATTAEDIAQEIFLEVWRKREQIQLNIGIKPYLRRSAVNRTLNHIRSKKMVFEDEEKAAEIKSETHSTTEEMEGREMQEQINKAIDMLPEKCRIVFAMSRFEELSYQEIAEKLEISKKTVENQISKALKFLRLTLLQPSG